MSRGYISKSGKRGANSYHVQIELDRIGNKRNRRFFTIKGTYKDAQKALTAALNAADAGTLVDPTRMTVQEYLQAWLDSSTTLSPKTRERYDELAKVQIFPHVGQIKIQKLKPEHLEQWHSALLASGLAPRTIVHAHRVLSVCLTRAVTNGTLARNVASVARPPMVEDEEVVILTPEQVSAVLQALKGHSIYPIVALALSTGMRRGELCALRWSDVDLDRGVLHVENSLEETRHGGLRVKPPKTKSGRRNISLSGDAVVMLREHRKQQLELRLVLGQGGQPALVFSNIEGGHIKPNSISRNWLRLIIAKKLPRVGFHALRHTHASVLIGRGVDILTVSRRLGHRKASVTLDIYGHLIEGADNAAADAIEGMLK